MQQVEAWRSTRHLPFPRMEPSRRENLADTLDYPPRGSPDAYRKDSLDTEHAEPLSAQSEEENMETDDMETQRR